jgi:hypothetical protein
LHLLSVGEQLVVRVCDVRAVQAQMSHFVAVHGSSFLQLAVETTVDDVVICAG